MINQLISAEVLTDYKCVNNQSRTQSYQKISFLMTKYIFAHQRTTGLRKCT